MAPSHGKLEHLARLMTRPLGGRSLRRSRMTGRRIQMTCIDECVWVWDKSLSQSIYTINSISILPPSSSLSPAAAATVPQGELAGK